MWNRQGADAAWLRKAAEVIRANPAQEITQNLFRRAQVEGLRLELARAIVIYDVQKSSSTVRKALAENILLLALSLEDDVRSISAQRLIISDPEQVLDRFTLSLKTPIGEVPERTEYDEDEITSIGRVLIECSGGTMEVNQYRNTLDFTVRDIANLCASVLDIPATDKFREYHLEQIQSELLESPLFLEKVSIAYLRHRITNLRKSLYLDATDDDESGWVFVRLHEVSDGCHSTLMNTAASTEQSDDEFLEILHTPKVATRCTKSDAMLPASQLNDRCPGLPPNFCADDYILISVRESRIVNIRTELPKFDEICNMVEVNGGIWEICILKMHRYSLRDKLLKMFPSLVVDLERKPGEPTEKDLQEWNVEEARRLSQYWFTLRAQGMILSDWSRPVSLYYWSCLCSLWGSGTALLPTILGYVKSSDDARRLVDACTAGYLAHTSRMPREGEAAVNGYIFVWEANATGIGAWNDGIEWNIRNEDRFEIGEARDSRLIRKSTYVFAYGCRHNIVSYYTASDARP